MAFLEVLTRCYKRPWLLQNNIDSLAMQTDKDFIHTLLHDEIGRGVEWSYENMRDYAPKLQGAYIWILDDDDVCVYSDLVHSLKILATKDPDVIMLRMDHGRNGVKPSHSWLKPPELGDIGCSAYVVRREIWQHHAALAWKQTRYQSDYDFITSIFSGGYDIRWYDVIASQVQRISLGQPE